MGGIFHTSSLGTQTQGIQAIYQMELDPLLWSGDKKGERRKEGISAEGVFLVVHTYVNSKQGRFGNESWQDLTIRTKEIEI